MKKFIDLWYVTIGIPVMLMMLAVGMSGGCQNLKDIPIFNPSASLRNRADSAEELLIQVNLTLAQLRTDNLLTQDQIDKQFKPRLNRAKEIILTTRAVAKGNATTQPTGTLDEARSILIDVRDILATLKGNK